MLTTILVGLIEKLAVWLAGFFAKRMELVHKEAEIDQETHAEAQAVKDAKTMEEQDKADTDLLNGH